MLDYCPIEIAKGCKYLSNNMSKNDKRDDPAKLSKHRNNPEKGPKSNGKNVEDLGPG